MPVTTRSGRRLSDADLDRLAEKAEEELDLTTWRPRRGRPFLDDRATGHSPRVTARIPADLRDRAAARAAREGRTMSEVVRGLLEDYAPEPPHAQSARRR
ncbi:MAG TPA: hypothetical protein VIK13_02535 [Candidatus Limnocylindrales bacterium]